MTDQETDKHDLKIFYIKKGDNAHEKYDFTGKIYWMPTVTSLPSPHLTTDLVIVGGIKPIILGSEAFRSVFIQERMLQITFNFRCCEGKKLHIH